MGDRPYPDYENPSGWNALLPPRTPNPPLSGDVEADVAIVGAGYTGIAAARRWLAKRGDDDLVLLESSEIGEGNPGRNSGFLLEIALANDADASQIARMQSVNRLIARTMHKLRDDVYDAAIACDIERAGTYRAAASAAGRRALADYRRFLDAAALPYERLGEKVLARRLGTPYYREGLYSPNCYLVQPAALIRGLASLLPERAKLYERSPALRIQPDAGRWRIETSQGAVTARIVLIANNAFAKDLGFGRAQMVAMYTYAGLTEPLPDPSLHLTGIERTWGLLPAHRLGCTLRRTRDGRLLIRAHYGYEREADNAQVAASLLRSLRERFPDFDIDGFAHVWGGATGYTANGSPIWGRIRDGIYVSAGCNGGGVVKGTLFGEALADLAMGEAPEADIPTLFGNARWMPPDPIRRVGFEIISRFERRTARAEM